MDSIAGSTKLTYDTLDRVTNVVDINGTITYRYNDAGLRTNMTVVGQNAVAYLYDAGNRLTNVLQGTFTTALSYDDDSRRTNLTLPNGIKVLYRYDTASRLTNITYLAAVTNQIGYTYDQSGSRVAQASLPVGLGAYNLPAQITNSTYNAANQQLTFGTYNILYDLDGNITNMISGTTTNKLLWSARNQLTNMLGAVTATFAYDGLSHRITRMVGSTTEKYLYDGLDIIQQLNNSGTVAANYLRSLAIDEPWQRIDIGMASTNRIYLADALGSIVALTDSSKNISNTYTYEAFGATTMTGATNKNCYEFTGRENDGTGLYYYRARYYNQALGRFVSEDPYQFIVGANLYTMVGNDPLDYQDPLGLFQLTITLGDGWGGQITFGRNSGQWNVGVSGGIGGGFSITLDPMNAACHKPGLTPTVDVSASAGAGKLSGTLGIQSNNEEPFTIRLTGQASFIPKLNGGVAINPFDIDKPIIPTAAIDAVGGAGGAFGGVAYYFSNSNKKCDCK